MTSTPTVKLNTGASIPLIGLGTWQSAKGEVAHAVEHALKSGYKHIDAAFCYQNEQEVGEGIKKSGVAREEIFVTSKLWSTYHSRVEEGLDITLRDLGLEYLDLYLMHWPVALNPKGSHPLFPRKEDGTRDHEKNWDFVKTWKEMEKLVETGKVKAVSPRRYRIIPRTSELMFSRHRYFFRRSASPTSRLPTSTSSSRPPRLSPQRIKSNVTLSSLKPSSPLTVPKRASSSKLTRRWEARVHRS